MRVFEVILLSELTCNSYAWDSRINWECLSPFDSNDAYYGSLMDTCQDFLDTSNPGFLLRMKPHLSLNEIILRCLDEDAT